MKAIKFGLLMVILALAGCASGYSVAAPFEETYKKGETSPNVFLSTVIVRPDGCAPLGTACTMGGPRGAVVIVPFSAEAPSWMYEMFAHELCHAVAKVKELWPDPCHQEDHGKIVTRRNGGMVLR